MSPAKLPATVTIVALLLGNCGDPGGTGATDASLLDASADAAPDAAPDAGPTEVEVLILHTADEHGWLQPFEDPSTGLIEGGEIPEARILDRPQWIQAATQSMRVMTGGTDKPKGFISGRITGAQTGAVLAYVSQGILGQYDPFGRDGGELLLVYPNVIGVERQLRVDPADFRLWVCLHEVTHRVQFRANPWLADHMSQSLGVLTQDAGDDIVACFVGLVHD